MVEMYPKRRPRMYARHYARGVGDTLSGALDDARRLGFVGRATELAAFGAALDGNAPARVLFVHGPGGIGKSTLLDEMRRRAAARGRPVVSLDGRDVAGSIPAVSAAVATVADDPGPVLLVDSYELLTPLDRWFRNELLPSLPADAVAVLAGREPPTPAWSADAGWRRLLRTCELTAMDAAESADLLGRFGAPESACARLAELGRGHPLALVLLAEAAAQGRAPANLADRPDLVAALCHVLVRDVPDAAHRTGLATCAHAFRTTEDLLAETVGERAPEVWAWLASRSFVRHSGTGLHLHDLMRDLVDTEFAQRNPQAYAALHRTIRYHATRRLRSGRTTHAVPRRHRAVPAAPALPAGGRVPAAARRGRAAGRARPGRRPRRGGRAGRAGPRAPARASSPRSGSPRSPNASTWRAPTSGSRGGPCSCASPTPPSPPIRWWRRCWRRWTGMARCGPASGSASAVSSVPDPVPGTTRPWCSSARCRRSSSGSRSRRPGRWSPPPTSRSGARTWSTSG